MTRGPTSRVTITSTSPLDIRRLFFQPLYSVFSIVILPSAAPAAGIPAVYVSDNFGRWQSNFNVQVEHCLRDGVRGRHLAERLRPEADDYFVLKPKHSGFFSTSLDILLDYLRVKALILTGIAANI